MNQFFVVFSTTLWYVTAESIFSFILIYCKTFFEANLDSREFSSIRQKLNKTQQELAQLLGTSIKAIHSYEQGWRTVPAHVERQLFFLLSRRKGNNKGQKPCWVTKKCPASVKKKCPAWEFQTGKLCWFINGTLCEGYIHKNWSEKMKACRRCEVFNTLLSLPL